MNNSLKKRIYKIYQNREKTNNFIYFHVYIDKNMKYATIYL